MSYDGEIEWHGRVVADIGNYTSNVEPMWRAALGFPLSRTSGWPVRLAEFVFLHCAQVMVANREEFEAMNPEDGWGDYDGALRYVLRAAEMCAPYRDDAIVVWSV